MSHSELSKAQQIAQAAIAFEQRRTGNHVPKSVTVVLSEGTLVITLHEALSPAERVMARSPAGAARVQEFHRQLFANSSESLRQEIERITGMDVREATAEIEPASGAVVQAQHVDACGLVHHGFQDRPGRFDQLDANLFEQVPPLLDGERFDQLLFGSG